MVSYLIYYIIFLLNIKITENTKAILIFNKKNVYKLFIAITIQLWYNIDNKKKGGYQYVGSTKML